MTIPTSSAVTELERLRDLIGMGLPHYLVPATTTTRRLDIECVPYVELRDAINDRLAVLRAQPATPEAAPPPAPEGTMPPLTSPAEALRAIYAASSLLGRIASSGVTRPLTYREANQIEAALVQAAVALTAAHQAGARQALEGVRQLVAGAHISDVLGALPAVAMRDVLIRYIDAQLAPPPAPEDQGRASERVADLVESVRQFTDFVEHGPGRREPDMTKFSSGRATPTTTEDAQP